MQRPAASLSLPLCFALSCCGTAAGDPAAPLPGPRAAAQDPHDARMAWWREARFGLFVHWGLYAIPAGAWGERTDHGEWIRTTARIPRERYEPLQRRWNPTEFDADAWARAAADAGMRYVVITSKHHDGFCLWDSAETDWDVGGTPHGGDVLAELAAACRRHGLRFCTYHSIMDWHHPDYLPRRDWETDRPVAGADFERYERYLHAQVGELVARYRPAVMWFDGEWERTWTHERGVALFELCRRLAPEMIVNNRVDVHRQGMQGFSRSDDAVGDFDTPEQEIPATGLPGVDWESCMTMNGHWGWNAADTRWKPTAELVRNLIDVASKGGNYLLNVGPRADGTFPPEAVERLRGIGAWMRLNGEAIHGTTASVFEELPWGRCTVRAGDDTSRLYLHVFERPASGELALPGLGSTATAAFLLTDPSRALAVGADGSGSGLVVRLPEQLPDPIATVVVVELGGRPIVYRAPTITAESERFVTGLDVAVASAPGTEARYTPDGREPTARSPRVEGPVRIERTCTVSAATFRDGRRVGPVARRAFERAEPLPPVEALPAGAGLLQQAAAVDWQRIPADRPQLDSKAAPVAEVALPEGIGEHVALSFRGFVDVPATELYRFALTSDDGSRLWIDGQLVVDNDGLHGAIERRGEIALAAGLHGIEVVWFNNTGAAELRLAWARPGRPFARVPRAALRH